MTCRICGAELPEGAMFCGECGSSTSATPESRRKADPRPGDTTIVSALPRRHSGVISIPVGGFLAPDAPAADSAEAVGGQPTDAALPAAAEDASTTGDAAVPAPPAVPDEPPRGEASSALAADRGVPSAEVSGPERFRLRFSTGETRIVFGTGLIGRKPLPQTGERFDHLVQIADRTLSVSKTHLEFGTHDGMMWIADRFSGNGTVVRRPDDGALRCEPGRRYLVPRGSTVEIAQQQFSID